MKKRLLFVFLLAIMIVSVAMVFVACNGNTTPSGPSNTYYVNVQYDEPEERIWISLISSVYYGAVPEGTDLKYHVQLRNDCVASSVKIYANGNPVTLDLIEGADDYEYIDEGIRDIGEFTLKNVKEDTVITYEYEEVQIKINLNLVSETDPSYSQPTGEQTQIFNGLSFDGDNHSLSYYTNYKTPYYTTYSQITDDYTLDGKPKTSGYLAVKSANTVNGAYCWDNFELDQGLSKIIKAFMYIPGEPGNLFNDWSRCSNNTFFVGNLRYKYEEGGTIYDSNSYYREMDITVNPSAIFDNPKGGFDSLGGAFKLTDPDLAFGYFDLGNNPLGGITFTLDEVEGVDYTNAEVYVWDTKIEPEGGVYTIDHAPMYYVSKPGDFDLRTDYKLYLKNVDYSQASNLYVLDIENNNAKVRFDNIGGYYDTTYYLDDSILVMRPDSAASSALGITFRYEFDSPEDVMSITGEYMNLLFNVTVNGTEELAFDLDNFLPNTENAQYDQNQGLTVCNTGTDVEVLYTGPNEGTTITDGSGTVIMRTYLFDITVSFAIAGGENSFVISGN